MAGKITQYPNSVTTLTDGDLFDVSDYDEVSAYESKKLTWANLLVNINTQITLPAGDGGIYGGSGGLITDTTVSQLANNLKFKTNGNAQTLYISAADGRVGIATTTPAGKLDVVGSAFISDNVGIGTTTPTQKLDVAGNALITNNSSTGTVIKGNGTAFNPLFKTKNSSNTTKFTIFDNGTINAVGNLYDFISTQGSGTSFQFTSNTTTNGANSFTVNSTSTTTARGLFAIKNDGNILVSVTAGSVNSLLSIYNHAGSQEIALSAGENSWLGIIPAAKLGIGTTSPTEKLEVAGNVKVGGTLAVNQATGVSTFTGTGASDTRIDLHNASTASLVRLRFGSSGAGANCAIAYNGATSAHISTFYQNSLYTNAQSGSKRIESTTGGYFIVTDNGSLSLPVTRLEMDTSGRFGFGITPDAALLVSVGGSIKVNGVVDFLESAVVSIPAANYGRVYAKTDGKVYYKNDAGTDYKLTNDGVTQTGAYTNFTIVNGLITAAS